MAKIQTLEQMRDYVKLMCGAPVVQIEVDDLQIDQCIEDSINILCRYLYNEASFFDYAIITIPSGTTKFHTSAMIDNRTGQVVENVQDIYDFQTSLSLGSINTMFSPANILLYEQYVTRSGYPGGSHYGSGDGGMMVLSNYEISMSYLKEVENRFTRKYVLDLLPGSEMIIVNPTPKQDITGVLSLYKRETSEYLYNHVLLKKLVVSKVKQIWGGLTVGKYDVQLPDGARINYSNIYDQGVREEEKVMEEIKSEGSPVDFYIA